MLDSDNAPASQTTSSPPHTVEKNRQIVGSHSTSPSGRVDSSFFAGMGKMIPPEHSAHTSAKRIILIRAMSQIKEGTGCPPFVAGSAVEISQ
ncbi:hypothetical protein NPIL_90971 [Nephila pilipes]|uniref:Uncharacterized protein n=1 Tax=Nephila pilipes TaxID=299642 RepID=A0A8X6NX32_NEPPI|nr:hypothetical protein NPIL_90971 [Nephila pilipes]